MEGGYSTLVSRVMADTFPSEKEQISTVAQEGLLRGGEKCIPQSASDRLLLLKDLVQELVNDPGVIAEDSAIVQAVSSLNRTLRPLSRSSAPTVTSSRASQSKVGDRPRRSPDGSQPLIPVLPTIPDKRLEKAVFTHPACGNNTDATYDRLEILGDAYIELIATRLVWERFPGIPSGRISQIRELLVKNETLADFAGMYAFDRRASVPANYSDQPRRWTKTKGDIFEAYVAAVILSRSSDGFHVVEQWLTDLWSPKLDSLGHQKTELRYKEALAKNIMGKGIRLDYVEERPAIQLKRSGTQTFFIGVYLTGWGWTRRHLGSGQGPSKVAAGDEAARNALSDTSLMSEVAAAKDRIALDGQMQTSKAREG